MHTVTGESLIERGLYHMYNLIGVILTSLVEVVSALRVSRFVAENVASFLEKSQAQYILDSQRKNTSFSHLF